MFIFVSSCFMFSNQIKSTWILTFVNICLQSYSYLQALKEAFEVFCNKGVSGSTSAELLATFCDNILKKGGSEKLSDEAIEDTLEKVHSPLCCVFSFSCRH